MGIDVNTSGLATAVIVVGYADKNGNSIPAPFTTNTKWSYAAPSGGKGSNSSDVLTTAAGVGLKNYLTDFQVRTDGLLIAGDLVIRDGAGGSVLARYRLPSGPQSFALNFTTAIVGNPNTALIYEVGGAVGAGVYVNAQGFKET